MPQLLPHNGQRMLSYNSHNYMACTSHANFFDREMGEILLHTMFCVNIMRTVKNKIQLQNPNHSLNKRQLESEAKAF